MRLYQSGWNSNKSIGFQSVIDIQSDRSVWFSGN